MYQTFHYTRRRNSCQFLIIDGGALVNLLKPAPFSTSPQYTENILIRYICAEWNNLNRVDIFWDPYFDNGLKNTTRKKRGRGIRKKLSPQKAIPSNWKDFQRNKIKLFDFLTKAVSKYQFENKEVQFTKQNTILTIALAETNSMDICTHKGDTIIIHLLDAAEERMKKIIIWIVDSDILRIVLGQFELIRQKHDFAKIKTMLLMILMKYL